MRTYDQIIEAAARSSVPADVAERAAARIVAGEVQLLGFSGKMASGKDSIAEAVMHRLGLGDALHYSFATPLKDECEIALSLAREGRANAILEVLNVKDGEAGAVFVGLVQAALDANPKATARTRTPEIRRVLQFWGTDVRRAENYNYWVHRAVNAILDTAAHGQDVFYTDGRFENEIAGSQEIGFRVVRLEVSPEVQAVRLAQRDGLGPDPEALQHVSETALDTYDGFDLVVNNEGPFEATVGLVTNWVKQG